MILLLMSLNVIPINYFPRLFVIFMTLFTMFLRILCTFEFFTFSYPHLNFLLFIQNDQIWPTITCQINISIPMWIKELNTWILIAIYYKAVPFYFLTLIWAIMYNTGSTLDKCTYLRNWRVEFKTIKNPIPSVDDPNLWPITIGSVVGLHEIFAVSVKS